MPGGSNGAGPGITGALTDSMVLPLLRSGVLRNGRLVVKDPSKVLLKARHAGQAGYPQRYAGNGGGRPHPVRHHQPGISLWLAL